MLVVHLYAHGEMSHVPTRDLMHQVVALEGKRLDVASQLDELRRDLERVENRSFAQIEYSQNRVANMVAQVEDLARRLDALEQKK
jgi:hypothetical protein